MGYTTTKEEALAVWCPKCNAAPDYACLDEAGKPRTACHLERHERAIELGARPTRQNGRWIRYAA